MFIVVLNNGTNFLNIPSGTTSGWNSFWILQWLSSSWSWTLLQSRRTRICVMIALEVKRANKQWFDWCIDFVNKFLQFSCNYFTIIFIVNTTITTNTGADRSDTLRPRSRPIILCGHHDLTQCGPSPKISSFASQAHPVTHSSWFGQTFPPSWTVSDRTPESDFFLKLINWALFLNLLLYFLTVEGSKTQLK